MTRPPSSPKPDNLSSLVKAVRSLAQAQAEDGKDQHSRHQENLRWTKRAFCTNAAYVALTFIIMLASLYAAHESERQASIAEETLKVAQDNFREEQKPDISLTDALGGPEFVPDQAHPGLGQVIWTYHYQNAGRSPATEVTRKHYIKIGNLQFTESFQEPDNSPGILIEPSRDRFNTVVSVPGISRDNFDKLMLADRGIEIAGRFTYHDARGGDYYLNFCLAHLRTGAILFCGDKGGNTSK